MCIEHQQLRHQVKLFMLPITRVNDTHWLSDKLWRHQLPPILKAQSTTRWKPHLWPKSSQQSTLVPKVSLEGEEKQQWHHVPRTIDVWTCRGPPAHALCYRWFALSLSHKNKLPMWPPTQRWTLLAIECIQMPMPLDDHDDRDCTIIVTWQHTHKTTAPLQLNRLQQATIIWYLRSRSWSQTVVGQQDNRFIQQP